VAAVLTPYSRRTRGPGCRIVGRLAGPSRPMKGRRSPWGCFRWLGRETSPGDAARPDRVALWWAGVGGRRAGRWPSQVCGPVCVGIKEAAEPGSPSRSLPPNPGRCHGPAGDRTADGAIGSTAQIGGRAPPRRNTRTPYAGSHSPASVRGSCAPSPSTVHAPPLSDLAVSQLGPTEYHDVGPQPRVHATRHPAVSTKPPPRAGRQFDFFAFTSSTPVELCGRPLRGLLHCSSELRHVAGMTGYAKKPASRGDEA
jgi:hypothetical protein